MRGRAGCTGENRGGCGTAPPSCTRARARAARFSVFVQRWQTQRMDHRGLRGELLGSLGAIWLVACGARAGLHDVDHVDAARPDAALPDVTLPDVSLPDAMRPDAALPDATRCLDGEIPAPRPLAPLSTARVTSTRPSLRWVLADGVDGATI